MKGAKEQLSKAAACCGLPERRGGTADSHQGHYGARSKPVKVVEAIAAGPLTKSFYLNCLRQRGVKMVAADNVEELVRLLHEEAN